MQLGPRARPLLALLLIGCSCALAHEVVGDVGDASAADARGPADSGVSDLGIVPPDDAVLVGDSGCEVFARQYRRCDSRCPYPCNAATGRCEPTVGICDPYITVGTTREGDACNFDPRHGGYDCWTGYPCVAGLPLGNGGYCLMDHMTGRPYPYCGPCLTPEFCLTTHGAGLPPFECVWSDGTSVVTGPPAGTCVGSPDPSEPFCGGACGLVLCPRHAGCVGISDTRSFGVCQLAPDRCMQSAPARTLDGCALLFGADCACLVPSPQPNPAGSQMGFTVLASVCRAYRAAFPGHADCVDATWTSIP